MTKRYVSRPAPKYITVIPKKCKRIINYMPYFVIFFQEYTGLSSSIYVAAT